MQHNLDPTHALVLLSGGQDSATCLAWALDRFQRVSTIGLRYGQTHAVEMDVRDGVRQRISALIPGWSLRLGPDHEYDAAVIGDIGASALTSTSAQAIRNESLPDTFVPGRNLVFLALSAALSYRIGAKHLVTGVCETDYSGYPDCRDDTIKAMQVATNLGCQANFVFHTPLMWLSKAQTWDLAESLGGPALVETIRTATHTCYQGNREHLHEWGYGCGHCPACELRERGWRQYASRGKQAA